MRIGWLILAVGLGTAAVGCGDDSGSPGDDGGTDVAEDGLPDVGEEVEADVAEEADAEADGEEAEAGPTYDFERYCGTDDWRDSVEAADVGALTGAAAGSYNTLAAGAVELMKVSPDHPFRVTSIRVAFAGGRGTARIRLMRTMGRSYPAGYPSLDADGANLVPPIDIEVTSPRPDDWIDLDVSEHGVFLEPREHYVVAYEHLAAGPYLSVEALPAGTFSRALMLIPGESVPYGVDGNYRLMLRGETFCRRSDADRWFGEAVGQPFSDRVSQRVAVSDLDGDGHDDVVINGGRPLAFFGDGDGDFAEPSFDPFPEAADATTLVFGDVDNDGDIDAFAAVYVSADGDGDGVRIGDGDCDDSDAAVHRGAAEVAGNGRDDDCDTTADDGLDIGDADADGVSIADGDCNDTRADVYPGAPELRDSRDNDCDGLADEDQGNTIQVNDGTGRFATVPSSGVEALDPSAAGAFGDADGDGFLDLYYGNWLVHYPDPPAVHDRFFLGRGDGTFLDAAERANLVPAEARACYGVSWADYDNDGDHDIFVGNYGYGLNFLWRNDGTGEFADVGRTAGVARDSLGGNGGNTFGGDWGDIDNDGDLDLFEANIAHPRYQPWSDPSLLLVNGGSPGWTFTESRDALGIVWDEGDVNAAFADYDNDGDLDLIVLALYTGHYARLYRNEGGTRFTDVTYEAGIVVHDSVGAVWSDVDEDGDLDLFVADREGADQVHLFRNRVGQDRGWVQFVLEGTATNRDGIGARVTLRSGGAMQIREVQGGGGHSNTQSTRVVHFGLGGAAAIESVTVRWMGGTTETFAGAAAGGRWRLVEGTGAAARVF
jgi:hypothetical protein